MKMPVVTISFNQAEYLPACRFMAFELSRDRCGRHCKDHEG